MAAGTSRQLLKRALGPLIHQGLKPTPFLKAKAHLTVHDYTLGRVARSHHA
jgi:hypothetical protein